jgi:hypothetical protein
MCVYVYVHIECADVGGLQAELAGAKLKHTEPTPKKAATRGRDGLLAAIQTYVASDE